MVVVVVVLVVVVVVIVIVVVVVVVVVVVIVTCRYCSLRYTPYTPIYLHVLFRLYTCGLSKPWLKNKRARQIQDNTNPSKTPPRQVSSSRSPGTHGNDSISSVTFSYTNRSCALRSNLTNGALLCQCHSNHSELLTEFSCFSAFKAQRQ